MRLFDSTTEKGFTLVELLVVVTIIGVLAVGVVLNMNLGRKETILDQTAQRILSQFRQAQSKSMTAQTENSDVPCGYGLSYHDPSTIYFFSEARDDCNNAKRELDGGGAAFTVTPFKLQEESVVKLTDSSRFQDVFFESPDGLVYIGGERNSSASSTVTVCLREACAEKRKTIRVSGGGVVEILD